MAAHAKFHYRSAEGLLAEARRLGLDIPYQEDSSILVGRAVFAGREVPNRLAVLPMEGADADETGGPSDLTRRRYRRYAAGGAGLIWVEATAVRPDGRSNPRQLLLTEENVGAFARLVEEIRAAAKEEWGPLHRPLLVLQLTHSGRFAKPEGSPRPRIVQHNPYLDPLHGLPPDYPLVSDGEIEAIRDDFIEAADLASSAGFDGVDIKACHGYLVSETLAAHDREDSRYGGPFENRTRLLLDIVRHIRGETPRRLVTSRLSATDTVPFPFGFGMDPDEPERIDLAEAKALIARLAREGVLFVALSLGVPAWRPHFGRPFDKPVPGDLRRSISGRWPAISASPESQPASPTVGTSGPGIPGCALSAPGSARPWSPPAGARPSASAAGPSPIRISPPISSSAAACPRGRSARPVRSAPIFCAGRGGSAASSGTRRKNAARPEACGAMRMTRVRVGGRSYPPTP
jgi:2,4-dienoyl-CoA reductase-like NADH-dependent reductase (Old Yellow Enzyme family)